MQTFDAHSCTPGCDERNSFLAKSRKLLCDFWIPASKHVRPPRLLARMATEVSTYHHHVLMITYNQLGRCKPICCDVTGITAARAWHDRIGINLWETSLKPQLREIKDNARQCI